uniref:Uncharacterized protein n=1 Tax=Corethron hystrix TaxID=216773 RepID=A0A7S1FRR7_9STRA|mmetsp:Transcript_23659/g.53967  ORF Transcript_23659/g.53967 Transcript_23659/m.53967 type:complete len:320 (+) Transcript_23659:76-1035(+)|eukprot:CAMPEP_0113297354 /NCGR_PEP_ID=MMETSP0010_2-20120614/254_1 /TAXON_ID=216773 ORGANISM="Corethron hystrix, Strain 308" /NCGR_SAMPLE_ID=MMETSP0010_2 /ASSEMBLY_ACC=CAM_ASM_000155 /LENGTH=319 /DNA_ID=CAMNT_0000150235 /DNA_START=27 /DNA_END=986 /DNA_ORIENTATION=- /assembly_acc=CAM_ASM_000155
MIMPFSYSLLLSISSGRTFALLSQPSPPGPPLASYRRSPLGKHHSRHVACLTKRTPLRPSQPSQVLFYGSDFEDDDDLSDFFAFSDATGGGAGPEDQSPVNEYLYLVQQPLFGWVVASPDDGYDVVDQGESRNRKKLLTRLTITYAAVLFIVCYPISMATYTEEGYGLQTFAAANVGAATLVFMLLFRIYAGWNYIEQRLTARVVEFEETGWYDGDVRRKSESERARDNMLYNDKIAPVMGAVKSSMLAITIFWGMSCAGYKISNDIKPLFNEYDAGMLKTLEANDKMAGVAASKSGGRPTYCNSRYYRAIANGGQGCD